MKFAIVGAGAMGSLAGALLVKGGAEVWLVNRSEKVVQSIQTNGLKVMMKGVNEVIKINAVISPEDIKEKIDVILFLVKSVNTEAAAKEAQSLAHENTYVMTLQNGIGNSDILAKYFNNDRILHGYLEFAGKVIEPGVVQGFLGDNSEICFGSTRYIITEEMKMIKNYFENGGIKVIMRENVDGDIWFKLRNNSANAVMGILRLSIGQAMTADGMGELLAKVRSEVIDVAKAKGIEFPPEKIEALKNTKMTFFPELFAHLPSTAQDVKNKRQTEIEFLNGAVYREGLKAGVPTPYNEMLYRLIKIMENTYEMQF